MNRFFWRLCTIFLILFSLFDPGAVLLAASPRSSAAEEIVTVSVDGNTVEQIAHNSYRGRGLMEITINSTTSSHYTYKVTSAAGTCIGTPCGTQNTLTFAVDVAGNATSSVDMDAIPMMAAGWYYVVYRLTGAAAAYDIDTGKYRFTTNFSQDLFLTKSRLIGFDDVSQPVVYFSIFEPVVNGNGEFTSRPLSGEVVTPTSNEFEFAPSSNTTGPDGRAAFFMFPRNAPGRAQAGALEAAFANGEPYAGTVSVDVSGQQRETFTATVPFARVGCLRGQVLKVDGLGHTTALKMDDTLYPGDIIKLMGAQYDSQGNPTILPLVCLDFYDGVRQVAESTFAKEGTWINIEIGPKGVSGIVEESWKLDLRNMQLDVSENYREYLKLAAYHLIASRLVAPLKWGWTATTAAKLAIKGLLRRTFGYKNQVRSQFLFEDKDDAPPTLHRQADRQPRVDNAVSEFAYTVPYFAVTFMGDGSVKVTNWDEAIEVSSQDADTSSPRASVVLPSGTYSQVDGEYAAFSAVQSIPANPQPGAITISPADGSHLTAPPLIEITYPWNVLDPVMQDTLDVRLNGVSVTPYLVRESTTSGSASWQTPSSWDFASDRNIIDAYILTRSGTIYTGTASFILDATPQQPQFLKAYRGPTQTILRWQPVQSSALAGYLVYRASSETADPVQVTSSPFDEPVYVTDQPGWYSVAAVNDKGAVSPLAGPVLGDVDPGVVPSAPSAPQDFKLTAGEEMVTIDFTPDSLVAAYQLERAADQAGPYTPVARFTSAGYQDRGLTPGAMYWYRLVALGLDLMSSTPAGPLKAVLTDAPPGAPAGLGGRVENGGFHLLWDPSPESDLAGYNLYRAELLGEFVKINSSPITATNFVDSISSHSSYAWHITAVDQQGSESQPSIDVTLSTWLDLQRYIAKSRLYLPVVVR